MLSLILFATLAQAPDGPGPKTQAGPPPVQGLALIDAKGTMTITRITPVDNQGGPGVGHQELWLKAPGQKDGEKGKVRAKVTQMMVTVVELPAQAVEAFTVDGKPIAGPKLAEMLVKERTVLIAADGKKVDPFHLQLYKAGTILLVPPGNLGGMDPGGVPVPRTVVPVPLEPPPFPPKKAAPDGRKPLDSTSQVSAAFDGEDDQKKDATDAPPPGGIDATLRLRDKLPLSAPPTLSFAVLELGDITLNRQVLEYRTETMRVKSKVVKMVPAIEEFEVNVNGKTEKRQRTVFRQVFVEEERHVTVTRPVTRLVKQAVPIDSIKSFLVTKEGKLEPLAKAKVLDLLTRPMPALLGAPDIDPRHLELIRPGTLYLSPPALAAEQDPVPMAPPEREPRR